MPFGAFALISLFYAVIGVRVVRDLWRHRREVFDRRFTPADRHLVDQAAFFVLVPIAVALHELGHAITIWSFGGKVTDFNYYVFAGSVSYREPFSDTQHIVVAAAGTIVNIMLCIAAVAVVFGKRPPFRASINELIFQFAIISGVNALIFYPLLDFAAGMEGDWSQMYDGGVPTLSAVIFIIHAGILLGSYVLWKNPSFKRRLRERTGVPAGAERPLFGGLRQNGPPAARPAGPEFEPASPAEARFRAAIDRVARGWHVPVQGIIERRDDATRVGLAWAKDTTYRAVILHAASDGSVTLFGGGVVAGAQQHPMQAARHELRRWPTLPDENDLTMAVRLGMEAVERWKSVEEPQPVSGPVQFNAD